MATIFSKEPQLASQDVGLIFVREYYTFLNKKPHRLHAFYNNDSTYVRGDEGKVSTTAKGQEEIRKKIEECQFQDCKVLITQVDSQASANNGILIQVLGEMCNRSGPSQKFSQTFFLATQTNGYYVLNDIFRFLKDEVDISYYTYDQAEPTSTDNDVVNTTKNINSVPAEPVPSPKLPVESEKPTTPPPAQPQQQQPEPVKDETKKEEEIVDRKEEKQEDVVKKGPVKKEKPEKVSPVVDTTTAKATPEVQGEKKRKPESNKKSEQKNAQKASSPVSSPTTPPPAKPKTWANLTAGSSNVEKSPSATAATIPATSTTPIPTSTSPTSTPSTTDVTPETTESPTTSTTHHKSHHPRKDATQIFIKSVIEEVTEEELLEAFSQFGEVKSCNILRNKNCAFMEFTTSEGCQKALAEHKVQVSGGHTVLAEERRYTGQNTNRYNNQGRSFEQRRSNTGPRRQNNQNRQGGKGRTTPQPQQQTK